MHGYLRLLRALVRVLPSRCLITSTNSAQSYSGRFLSGVTAVVFVANAIGLIYSHYGRELLQDVTMRIAASK